MFVHSYFFIFSKAPVTYNLDYDWFFKTRWISKSYNKLRLN